MLGLAYWHFERELSFSSRKTPAKGRKSGVLKGAAREKKKERENRQKRILPFGSITQRIDRLIALMLNWTTRRVHHVPPSPSPRPD